MTRKSYTARTTPAKVVSLEWLRRQRTLAASRAALDDGSGLSPEMNRIIDRFAAAVLKQMRREGRA